MYSSMRSYQGQHLNPCVASVASRSVLVVVAHIGAVHWRSHAYCFVVALGSQTLILPGHTSGAPLGLRIAIWCKANAPGFIITATTAGGGK